MSNLLTETLEEIYEDVAREMQGGYGDKLKTLISGMLESCEADSPIADIQSQLEPLTQDIYLLQSRLQAAIVSKLSMKP